MKTEDEGGLALTKRHQCRHQLVCQWSCELSWPWCREFFSFFFLWCCWCGFVPETWRQEHVDWL